MNKDGRQREDQVDWRGAPRAFWSWAAECLLWPFRRVAEHLVIEAIVTLAGVAMVFAQAIWDGKDWATAARRGLVGGLVVLACIYIFYLALAPSQIHNRMRTRDRELLAELTAKDERLAFIRESLLRVADAIREFDDAHGTFGPPTRQLQKYALNLIRASLRKGRTIEREFMVSTKTPVTIISSDQLRFCQRQSVLELERIAEEVVDEEILPSFQARTWATESVNERKREGEAILANYSTDEDVNWRSARDVWCCDTRRWIEIFVSRAAAQAFMSSIDYDSERGRLESHIRNLDELHRKLTEANHARPTGQAAHADPLKPYDH